MPSLQKTDEEKKNLIKKIDAHRDAGLKPKEAARKEGIADVTYYAWKKKFGMMKARPYKPRKNRLMIPVDLPMEDNDIVILAGKSSEIRHALERLAQIRGVK